MQNLTVLMVALLAVAVFATTPLGKRLTARIGLRFPRNHFMGRGRAPREDHEYLLRVCNGDPDLLRERLEAARRNHPEMNEAECYRKAIRTHLRPKI